MKTGLCFLTLKQLGNALAPHRAYREEGSIPSEVTNRSYFYFVVVGYLNGNGGRKNARLPSFSKKRKRMKVIYTIRVKKENINELSKLEAVERIFNNEKGRMVVLLKQDFTDGKREVAENDYIVQWKNGKYQRFGAVAFDNLFKTPSEEGKQWL